MHGGKNWCLISALVPGRTKIQCNNRWHDTLDPNIGRASGRTGKRTAVEDTKLKDAVKTYGGKNWSAISALVPNRTPKQCRNRWHHFLDPNFGGANRRTGKWAAIEVAKLNNAVARHGDKSWKEVAALVPGRTKKECCDIWKKSMDPNRSTVRGQEHGTLKNSPALG
jgi:hypothetical protein